MPRSEPPKIISRPKLALWLWLRGLTNADAAAVAGVGREQVRRYCLAFSDPMRVVPPTDVIAAFYEWTGGDVTAADYYPAELNAGHRESGSHEGLEARL